MRTWKAANPPRDAGRRRALGKPMSNSSFLGLLFCVILSCFAKGAWAVTVVAGGEHTCAILNDGSVKCWGRNHKGQLASGDYTDRSIPTPTDLLPRPVVKLALGHQHTCVVLDDGTARCWGDNFYGQLGNGEDGVADRVPQTPQGFGSTGSVTDIACGEEFTCAIRTDGTVECWGRGGSGQIGHGAFSGITTPYPTSPTISAIDIALGGMAACALLQDGSVKCWGNNDYGQLGIGSYGGGSYFSPQTQSSGALGGKATIIFMSWYPGTNYDHVCATMENGDVMCWGWNSNDILGLGNGDNPAAISSPTISPSMSSVTQDVTMGGEHTCIVYNNGGGVGCFGDNYYGQFAGTSPYAWSPIGSSAANISAGYRHTCAVMDDDSVYCWGANGNGQLGTGNSLTQSEPTLIMCGTNKYAGSTSCTNCPSGKVNPAGDAVYGSGTGTCALAPSPPPAPPSEPECAAPTSHSLLTDSCATCFAGFYTSNSSVYYDCLMNWIYYFSPEYVTFDGSQPTWNGGAFLNHDYGRSDSAGSWLTGSSWMYAASATFKGFNCSTGDLSDGLVPSNFAGIDAAVVYDQNVDGGTWQYSSGGGDYGTNQWVMDNLCAPDCACTSAPSPSVPEPTPAASVPPPPAAQAKKEAAETTRDSILADFSDARLKAKVKLLADAAIAGVKVQRLSAKISAADENAACTDAFSKAGMSAGNGACVATAASSGKRRRLHSTTYDVELMFSASTVSDDAIKAAELEMKNNGVQGVTSQTSLEPITELKTVPGVDTGKLQTFETEAQAAAMGGGSIRDAAPGSAPAEAEPRTRRRRRGDGSQRRPHSRCSRGGCPAASVALVVILHSAPGDVRHPRARRRRRHPVSHVEVVAGLLHVTRADVATRSAVSRVARRARARPSGATDRNAVDAVKVAVAAILAGVRGRDARHRHLTSRASVPIRAGKRKHVCGPAAG